MRCKRTVDQNEKNFTYKALFVALKKKNSRLFTIFPHFISIFQTFSRSRKLLGKFHDFLKNSRLCTNPVYRINNNSKTAMQQLSCFCISIEHKKMAKEFTAMQR